jgi:hypothetical protein
MNQSNAGKGRKLIVPELEIAGALQATFDFVICKHAAPRVRREFAWKGIEDSTKFDHSLGRESTQSAHDETGTYRNGA